MRAVRSILVGIVPVVAPPAVEAAVQSQVAGSPCPVVVQVDELYQTPFLGLIDFGAALAVDSDLMVVGAPDPLFPPNYAATAAFVYERNQGTWVERTKLLGGTTEPNGFGAAVALSGATALVGAELEKYVSRFKSVEGAAYDPDAGTLYAVDDERDELIVVDPSSGTAQVVGPLGFDRVRGLAFDRSTGVLYGSDVGLDLLVAIDPATGAGSAVGPLGFDEVEGLARDPVSGVLFGTDLASDQLLVIDPLSGAAAAVGPLGFGAVRGLAWDAAAGVLFGTDLASDSLVRIDRASGAGTAVGPIGTAPVRSLAHDGAGAALHGVDRDARVLVALDPVTAAPTAIGSLDTVHDGAGAAYLFEQDAGGAGAWGQVAELTGDDPADDARLGSDVALEGDLACVGAEGAPLDGVPVGAAYVFARDLGGPGAWGQVARLTASDPGLGDGFGAAVAVSGDTLVVGAPQADDPVLGPDIGAVYVFERDPPGAGAWTEVARLLGREPEEGDLFGSVLDLDGDALAVGARGDALDAVHVFRRQPGGQWELEASLLTTTGGNCSDHSVALRGDHLAVGRPHTSSSNCGDLALLFERANGAWTEVSSFTGLDVLSNLKSAFGADVALGSEELLVGAPKHYHGSPTQSQGAVYVFDLPALGASAVQAYCTAGISASGCAAAVCGAGDASASLPSGFQLTAAGVEAGAAGIFFFGASGRQATPWGNGTSYQCVAPPVARTGLLSGSGTGGGACDWTLAQDLNAYWCPTCPAPGKNPGAGATCQLQLWYRDPLSTSNQTTSLSSALEFTVLP